jgi:subtilisin family serine protease
MGRTPLALFKIGIYFFLLVAFLGSSCKIFTHRTYPSSVPSPCDSGILTSDTFVWASYNILFQPNSTKSDRNAYLNAVDAYLCTSLSQNYRGPRRIHHENCPCGPLLVNVQVVIDASGGSVTGTPPPGPPPGVSSGSVQYYAANTKVQIPELGQGIQADTGAHYIDLGPKKKVGKTILAIIDTGLDTLVYNNSTSTLGNWIWKDPAGTTQYNFVGGSPWDFRDQSTERHGTIVTAMALDMFKDTTVLPQLMILKALDDHGAGTIFSVACAISYAICHHATVINASFGYYGAPDPILLQCILNSGAANIPVIAAAGNVGPPHVATLFCSSNNLPDNLGQNNLFYPACFADTMGLMNLISVANVNQPIGQSIGACFYQNHSPKYVSTGVLNTNSNDCCQYNIPFLVQGSAAAEGSSFATPVVSGQIDRFIEGGGLLVNGTNWLQNHSQTQISTSAPCCTINGQYVLYSGTY